MPLEIICVAPSRTSSTKKIRKIYPNTWISSGTFTELHLQCFPVGIATANVSLAAHMHVHKEEWTFIVTITFLENTYAATVKLEDQRNILMHLVKSKCNPNIFFSPKINCPDITC